MDTTTPGPPKAGHTLPALDHLLSAQGAVNAAMRRFQAVVARRTGIQLREEHLPRAWAAFTRRPGARQDPLGHLDRIDNGTSQAREEWQALAAALSNHETFFFRDHGQFKLLRTHVFPELIRARAKTRSLRIWSAGCSTGEEPYSLAMLLEELLPDVDQWSVSIVGTDLDPLALQHARAARYRPTSFRGVPPDALTRHFRRVGDLMEPLPSVRRFVSFETSNLVLDEPPASAPFDLVVCRNVFIYFDRPTIQAILAKMTRTLRPDGFLLVGHTETLGLTGPELVARSFPESTIYQRASAEARPEPAAPPVPSGPSRPQERAARTARSPPLAPAPPPSNAPTSPPVHAPAGVAHDGRALLAEARAAADAGDTARAAAWVREAIARDPFLADAYVLLAHLEVERGEGHRQAKEHLRRAIYLEPEHVAAHLELAWLHEADDEPGRARSLRAHALKLLRTRPPSEPVPEYGGMSAAQASEHVRGLLGDEAA